MAGPEQEPFLGEQDASYSSSTTDAPWEIAGDVENGAPHRPHTIKRLLSSHPDDVLRTLQREGVSKLGEFTVSSEIAFPAFTDTSILTLGKEEHDIDYETVWRSELERMAARRGGKKREEHGWCTNVIVEAFVVNVADAADPDQDGILQPLLRRYQAEGCGLEVFGLPAVQAIITFKWQTFARRLLLAELAIFLVWLFAFFGFTWIFQDEDLDLSLSELARTPRGAATIILEIVALLAMIPFLVLEQGTLSAYGFQGWLNIWNGLDIFTYCIQIAVTVLHLSRKALDSDALSVLLALQCILLLFRVQFFTRCFTSTRFSFLEAIRDVISQIRHYFVFMLVIVFGFSAAFHILFRRDQSVSNFDTLPHSFLKVYSSMDSGLEYDEMLKSHVPVAASFFNVAYAFIMGLVLVNFLIGTMTTALERVTEHEALKLLLHKGEIIDEIESTLPRWIENKFDRHWYPAFVHCLRIDTDRLDRPDLKGMWDEKKKADEDDGAGGNDADVASSELHAKLDSMAAQLARLEAALAGTGGKA